MPALMNAGFAVLFFYSIGEAKRLFDVHKRACKELRISEFNMNPLRSVCQIFFLVCSVATVGILLLMAFMWWAPNWSLR